LTEYVRLLRGSVCPQKGCAQLPSKVAYSLMQQEWAREKLHLITVRPVGSCDLGRYGADLHKSAGQCTPLRQAIEWVSKRMHR
jgi:hypothetical protein